MQTMNFILPDHLADLNRRKIERDRVFILKEAMLRSKPGLSSFLDGLGSWMVAQGRNLHERYSAGGQVRSVAVLQDSSKILRAETQL
jgi:hypothetical protein